MLQQHLPFTVLKPTDGYTGRKYKKLQQHLPFTVLKLSPADEHGKRIKTGCNSTYRLRYWNSDGGKGIKEIMHMKLQQHLPFTVLKPRLTCYERNLKFCPLQQHLPFTVLKLLLAVIAANARLCCNSTYRLRYWNMSNSHLIVSREVVATAPTVYGIETP